MASHSEHFDNIVAAIKAARADGYFLYVDGMEVEDYDYAPASLNLWHQESGVQLDFPETIWSYN